MTKIYLDITDLNTDAVTTRTLEKKLRNIPEYDKKIGKVYFFRVRTILAKENVQRRIHLMLEEAGQAHEYAYKAEKALITEQIAIRNRRISTL